MTGEVELQTQQSAGQPWPRKLLHQLTSPMGTALVFGVFVLCALAFYFAFNVPRPDGGADVLLCFGLVSQFIGLLCLLVMLRALRDGRLFEVFFVVVFVIPLNSIAMQAAIHASSGTPLPVDVLTRSSFLFSLHHFSGWLWVCFGTLVFALGVALWWSRGAGRSQPGIEREVNRAQRRQCAGERSNARHVQTRQNVRSRLHR